MKTLPVNSGSSSRNGVFGSTRRGELYSHQFGLSPSRGVRLQRTHYGARAPDRVHRAPDAPARAPRMETRNAFETGRK